MPAVKPLEKNIPRHQLDPFSSHSYRNMWMRPITQPFFQAYRSADTRFEGLTIIPQLQSIRRVNFPALKVDFLHSSVGIRSLKDFFSSSSKCYSQ